MYASMRCGLLPALAGLIFVLVEVLSPPSARAEEETCPARCWETYGECYRSTSNRRRCQAQLLRCLNNCIRAKPKPAIPGASPPRHTPEKPPGPGGKPGPAKP
jgi:hypothetical protein